VVPLALLPHLRRARDRADRQYAEPLDLDLLADTANVSKYHFARCFARTYGEAPMRYLTRRRIERAQDLLRSANLSITEVCMLVGFSSLGSFSSRSASWWARRRPSTATAGRRPAVPTSPAASCSCGASTGGRASTRPEPSNLGEAPRRPTSLR
jgi:AraC-like DNA-binding protein